MVLPGRIQLVSAIAQGGLRVGTRCSFSTRRPSSAPSRTTRHGVAKPASSPTARAAASRAPLRRRVRRIADSRRRRRRGRRRSPPACAPSAACARRASAARAGPAPSGRLLGRVDRPGDAAAREAELGALLAIVAGAPVSARTRTRNARPSSYARSSIESAVRPARDSVDGRGARRRDDRPLPVERLPSRRRRRSRWPSIERAAAGRRRRARTRAELDPARPAALPGPRCGIRCQTRIAVHRRGSVVQRAALARQRARSGRSIPALANPGRCWTRPQTLHGAR